MRIVKNSLKKVPIQSKHIYIVGAQKSHLMETILLSEHPCITYVEIDDVIRKEKSHFTM